MSDRKILLEETKDFMQDHCIKPNDVLYCKTNKYKFPWIVFKRAAMISYDSGFGLAEINLNLEIHGCTEGHRWVMFRREYDGSEWWDWEVDYTEGLTELTEKDLPDIMEKKILTTEWHNKEEK